MFSEILRWSCNALILALLIRAFAGQLLRKYPIFYFYLAHVLLFSLLRYYVYTIHPGTYASFYWQTEIVSVAVGYCVIWEICNHTLADYSGTARMARLVVSTLFLLVLGKVLLTSFYSGTWSLADNTIALERLLRTVQVVLLASILALLIYYKIPLGENVSGIILGYGFFLVTGIVLLTLRNTIGDAFQVPWRYFQPAAYLVTLSLWSAKLWSYQPNPKAEAEITIEQDYEALVEETVKSIARARHLIGRTIRA